MFLPKQAEDSAAEETRTIDTRPVGRRTAEIVVSLARIAPAEITGTTETETASENTEAVPDPETGETSGEEAAISDRVCFCRWFVLSSPPVAV